MPTPQGTRQFDRGANADRGEQPSEPRKRSNRLTGPQLLFLFVTPAILIAVTVIIKYSKPAEEPVVEKRVVITVDPNVDINQFKEHLKEAKKLCRETQEANLNELPDFKAKHKQASDNCDELQEELDGVIENHKDKKTKALPPELSGLNGLNLDIQQMRLDLIKIAPMNE